MNEMIKEMLETKQYHKLREYLGEQNPADIAQEFSEFSEKDIIILFRLLPKDLASETFVYMDADLCEMLIRAFSDAELRCVLSELYVDDTVDIIEEMPANVVSRILRNTDRETRAQINEILRYPQDSAGSIMTTEYVAFPKDITCDEALVRLRRVGIDKETIYTCYVTEKRKLIGVVTVKDMLISSEDTVLDDIMEKNIISVTTTQDKEEVANLFDKYDFLALPVVDKDNRIVGIVTVDDAIDVIRDEIEEDFEMMAAVTPSDKPYLKMGVFELAMKRLPWLFLLMISATFTGGIITSFEESLGAMPILTAYIPMLMGTGGNAGGQSSVAIIRGLALDELNFGDIFRVMWKESSVAIICGAVLAVANFLKIVFFDGMLLGNSSVNTQIALAVSLTLVLTVIIAKVIGSSLPLLAKKIGFDPAVMASPFITTIVDALALMAYFNVSVSIISNLS